MAKTTFVDGNRSTGVRGTRVVAAFFNTLFGLDGHVHDGIDADGHAPVIVHPYNYVTESLNINKATHHTICASAADGVIVPTLPPFADTPQGREFRFKKQDSSANAVIITVDSTSGTDDIDGDTTLELTVPGESVTIVRGVAHWHKY